MLRADGFSYGFDPSSCDSCGGKCCTGESGYIWISSVEMADLSKFLDISVDELKERFLDKFGYKFSIKEKPFRGGYACVFFDEKKLNCGIYEARPSQCRNFPFWDYFKQNLKELKEECVGIRDL